MEAYPTKVREQVPGAYEQGMKTKQIAERFGVGRAWCRGVKQRLREQGLRGAIEQKHGPDPFFRSGPARAIVGVGQADARCDAGRSKGRAEPAGEHQHDLADAGRHEADAKKKSRQASERERPDVVARRLDWEQSLPGVDVERFVFIDESSVNDSMVRECGRCPRGQRLVESVPAGLWKTSTLVAGIRLEGVVAPMVIDGPLNGETFAQYVESSLVGELRAGDIVVMDNLPVHKSRRVAEAILAVGCILVFLPPYSPDLRPIEPMWSKVKSILRNAPPGRSMLWWTRLATHCAPLHWRTATVFSATVVMTRYQTEKRCKRIE